MGVYENIYKIFEFQSGLIKTSDVLNKGISNYHLEKLVKEGKIEKIKRGYYQWKEGLEVNEAAFISKLFQEAIICMDSALFYYEYTDRTPKCWHIAVDKNTNKSKFNIKYPSIKVYYIDPKIIGLGITNENIDGVMVKIYDRERVICDIIKYSNKIDKEIMNKAIQAYLNDTQKNISKLVQYAKILRVYKKLELLVGVWL